MPRTYQLDASLGAPALAHTMTDGAEDARQAVRRYAHNRNLDRTVALIVHRHGRPPRTPIPAAAERFRAAAEAAGFEVHVGTGRRDMNVGKSNERSAFAWTVAGIDRDRRLAFRAVWVGGKASTGEWWDAEHRDGESVGVGEVTARVRAL